jgi:XPG domain containing
VVLLKSLEFRLGSSASGSESGDHEVQVLVGTRYHSPSLSSKLNLDLNLPSSSSSSSGGSGSSGNTGGSDGGTPLQRLIFERSLDPTISTSELKRRCLMPLSSRQQEREYADFLRLYSTEGISHPDRAGAEVGEEAGEEGGGGGRGRDEDDVLDAGALKSQARFLLLQGLDPRVAELVVQFQQLKSRPQGEEGTRSRSRSRPRSHTDDDREEEEEETKGHEQEQEHEQGYLNPNPNPNLPLSLHIYLPPLLEDPSRDSAWSYGREIRALGYGLLRRHFTPGGSGSPSRVENGSGSESGSGRKRKASEGEEREEDEDEDRGEALRNLREVNILEYYRRGTRIVGVPVMFLSENDDDIETQIHSLLDSLDTHNPPPLPSFSSSSSSPSSPPHSNNPLPPPSAMTMKANTNTRFWHSYALTALSEQRTQAEKAAPSSAWAHRHLNPDCRPCAAPRSWDEVHDQACVEAVLYSLRMVKQITSLVVGSDCLSSRDYRDRDEGVGSVPVQHALTKALESLPSSLPELLGEMDIEINTSISTDAASQVSSRAAVRGETRLEHSGGEGAGVGGHGHKHPSSSTDRKGRAVEHSSLSSSSSNKKRLLKHTQQDLAIEHDKQKHGKKNVKVTRKKAATRDGRRIGEDNENIFMALAEVEG